LYYYLKLASISNSYTEAAVLSLLLQGQKRTEVASYLGISYKQVSRLVKGLFERKILDDTGRVPGLPENYKFPFIYLSANYIKEFGLGAALYFNYQRTWNDGVVGPDQQAQQILKLSRRSITNYKRVLQEKGFIKGGKIDVDRIENVFTNHVGKEVQKMARQEHSASAREKIKSKLKQSDVAWIFKALCAEYGYTKIPPPLKSDIHRTMAIQQTLEDEHSEVTIGDLMERLIKRWDTLWGKRPPTPTLGHLPMYYKDLWIDEGDTIKVSVTAKEKTEALPPSNIYIGLRKSVEEEDIDEYNDRMIGGE
jgi:DNA-binding CsgD family transcriptional regulator